MCNVKDVMMKKFAGLIALVFECSLVVNGQTYTDSSGYTWVYTLDVSSPCIVTVSKVVPAVDALTDLNVTAFPGCKVIFKDGAFSACGNLKSVVLPAMTADLTSNTFQGCDSLESISVASGADQTYDSINGLLCTMAKNRVLVCPNALESVEIPEGVVALGVRAFTNCSKLRSIYLPKSLAIVDEFAFLGCENLKDVYYNGAISSWINIEFHEDTTSDSKRHDLFTYNNPLFFAENFYVLLASGAWSKVKDFDYSSKDQAHVYNYAFYGYKGLERVTIEGGTSVGSYSFAWCENLRSLKIGDPKFPSTTYPPMHRLRARWNIGSSFAGCTNLVDIQVLPACEDWCEVEDGVVYSKGMEEILLFPASKREYVAPNSLTAFMVPNAMAGINGGWGFDHHFTDCCCLESLRLPTYWGYAIGEDIFYNTGVPNVFTVYVPTNYTMFTQYSFRNCAPGTTIIFEGKPNESEGGYCGVAQVANVSKIGITGEYSSSWYSHIKSYPEKFFLHNPMYTFDLTEHEITGLEIDARVRALGVSPLEINISSNCFGVYVDSVSESAFKGAKSVRDVTVGDGIRSIGEEAFCNCESMTNLLIASSVERIGARAFAGTGLCTTGADLIVSGWLLSVSSQNSGCYQVSDDVYHISDDAFTGCENITSVSIHGGVVSIGRNAFSDTGFWAHQDAGLVICDGWVLGCKGTVPSILCIPDGVVGIADEAFENCLTLEKIVLPRTLRFVGIKAFSGCMNLANAQFETAELIVRKDAFYLCNSELRLPLPVIMSFDACGGTMPSEFDYVKSGDKIGTLPVPVKEGCKFQGWYDDAGNEITGDDVVLVGRVCHATWIERYVLVEFDAAGGECKETSRYCERDLPIGTMPVPTRYGYDFIGWYTQLSGGDKICADNVVSGAAQYYAHWSKTQYYVQFVVDQTVVKKLWVYHGETAHAPNDPVKVGYEFVGWDRNPKEAIYGDTIFNAVWNQIFCTVKFEISDALFRRVGGGELEQQVPYGSYAEIPIVEPLGDFKFKEWPQAAYEEITADSTFVAKIYQDGHYAGVRYSFDEAKKRLTLIGDGDMGGVEKDGWFKYVDETEEIEIQEGITSISANAFNGFWCVKSALIASSVTNIGANAFTYCSRIKEVVTPLCFGRVATTFSSSVEIVELLNGDKIPKYLFTGCNALRRVEIPKSVQTIEGYAFYGCDGKTEFVVDNANLAYTNYLGSIYSKDMKKLVRAHIEEGTICMIEGTERIFTDAFGSCDELEEVDLPRSLVEIGNDAFRDCIGLQKVVVPENVTTIGSYAFENCSLVDVKLPGGASIQTSSFRNCSMIKNLTMPICVKKVADYFPSYKFLTNLVICSGVKRLGDRAIGGCQRLQTLTISESVTEISKKAFRDTDSYLTCMSLSRLVFLGDEPVTEDGVFDAVAEGCVAYVRRSGVVWNVAIPGKWHGISVEYLDESHQSLFISIDSETGVITTNQLSLVEAVEIANKIGGRCVCKGNLRSSIGLSTGVELVVEPIDDQVIDMDACRNLLQVKAHSKSQDTACFKIAQRMTDNGAALFEVQLDEDKFDFANTLSMIVARDTVSALSTCQPGEFVVVKLTNAKEGFYYGVESASDLNALKMARKSVNLSLADSNGVSLPIMKHSGNASFFRLVVSDHEEP